MAIHAARSRASRRFSLSQMLRVSSRSRAISAATPRLPPPRVHQRDGPVEPDREHVLVVRQRHVVGAVLQPRAVEPDSRQDRLARAGCTPTGRGSAWSARATAAVISSVSMSKCPCTVPRGVRLPVVAVGALRSTSTLGPRLAARPSAHRWRLPICPANGVHRKIQLDAGDRAPN